MGAKLNLRKNLLVDTMFLLNSIVSTLPLTIVIFFLLDTSLTEENISFLFSLKFWGVSIFSFLFIPLSKKISIKNIIILSALIKLIAYFYFFFEQTFYGAITLVALSSLSASLFTTASKIYIQTTSENISLSLSRRFTLNNIGVSITPILLMIADDANTMIFIALILNLLLFLLTLMLEGISAIKSEDLSVNDHEVNLDNGLLLFIFISCLLFSIFYLTYEKNIPISLERKDDKAFYATLVAINTIMIIFLQIKTFSLMTELIGVYNAVFLSYTICSIAYFLFFVFNDSYLFMILFVIGITYLEMFFSTGVDSIIIEKGKRLSKYYFIAFNVFIAISITLSSYFLTLEKYILPIIIMLLIILKWIMNRIKQVEDKS
ncbi:hypothetical protein BKK50_10705 [Rodentibacter rarus]|uniref:MFS transporter n=1 Tax=Rodentibacter rarus TaxID=1908260 RepID=A0A1V3IF75_9PAST|nr:hypothetical protein BKK50_10705 [Rodentibacter rarus]